MTNRDEVKEIDELLKEVRTIIGDGKMTSEYLIKEKDNQCSYEQSPLELKQKLIDKAVDFLKQDLFSEELVEDEKTYVCSATASTIDEFINNFKKYMED